MNHIVNQEATGSSHGKFITFEGIDGAGKTTHLEWFRARLQQELILQSHHLNDQGSIDVVLTREPGGTPLGEALRDLLLHQPVPLMADTEAMLMFAARCEHIAKVIKPALERGDWVISDRFTDATFAYQGGGQGLGYDRLMALRDWTQHDFSPDLTLLFDLPIDVARNRSQAVRVPDKFEGASDAFFTRVRQAYLECARREPERFIVIDASQTQENIRQILEGILVKWI
jgi:dTMP kinase